MLSISLGLERPLGSQFWIPSPKRNPFQRVPEQRALCIALQYKNLKTSCLDSEYHGTYDDAIRVRDMLISARFFSINCLISSVTQADRSGLSDYRKDDIMILMDDDNEKYPMPTRQKIVSSASLSQRPCL